MTGCQCSVPEGAGDQMAGAHHHVNCPMHRDVIHGGWPCQDPRCPEWEWPQPWWRWLDRWLDRLDADDLMDGIRKWLRGAR